MKKLKIKQKNKQKGGFLGKLLRTLAAGMLGSALTEIRAGEGRTKVGERF